MPTNALRDSISLHSNPQVWNGLCQFSFMSPMTKRCSFPVEHLVCVCSGLISVRSPLGFKDLPIILTLEHREGTQSRLPDATHRSCTQLRRQHYEYPVHCGKPEVYWYLLFASVNSNSPSPAIYLKKH